MPQYLELIIVISKHVTTVICNGFVFQTFMYCNM